MELEDKEVLQKFLFLHLFPNHLKNRVSSTLSLGLVDFKRCVSTLTNLNRNSNLHFKREMNHELDRSNMSTDVQETRLIALTIKTIVTDDIEIR